MRAVWSDPRFGHRRFEGGDGSFEPIAALGKPYCGHPNQLPIGSNAAGHADATVRFSAIKIGYEMFRKSGLVFLCLALASCGEVNSDGSVASGPLGQTPLMTAEVQRATHAGVTACADAKTTGAPLLRLTAQGFVPWRGGYRVAIDNPLIFAGNSSVSVEVDRRGACHVKVTPIYPIELQTLQSVTAGALAGRGARLDVWFVRKGDAYDVVLN